MQFNNYFWDLYKQSSQGSEIISLFETEDHIGIAKKFQTGTYLENLSDESVAYYQNSELKNLMAGERTIDFTIALSEFFRKFSFDNPRKTLTDIIDSDLYFPILDQHIQKQSYSLWIDNIENFSTSLFFNEKRLFIPYYFRMEFNILQNIFEHFEIPLPKIPLKKDWRSRLLYYIDICEALFEFRKHNSLSRVELCAFLYDFAPNSIHRISSEEMPKPTKAWFCGGNKLDFEFLDNAISSSKSFWQGSVDTRKGDIIVMYCLSPRSYVHSIWLADCDGFIDPFFYYYTLINISQPVKILPVSQKELKENEIFSKSPLIRSNMQGLVGYPIKYEEYIELHGIIESKGQLINKLPRIEPYFSIDNNELSCEKDVEEKLIEPLLLKLGYSDNEWIRQMPIKMGRGERNYPDYCFEANSKTGEESAKSILEAKFSIRSRKELSDAYFQTKSYALRLESNIFIVAAKEGVWIFDKNKGQFDINIVMHYSWSQLEHPDSFHEVLKSIGKKA
jgi:hypothetical protein